MRIVLAPFGSLGDLHPFLAIAIELRRRGHDVVICTLEVYREKLEPLGFEFHPLRPDFDPEDRETSRRVMDTRTGTETLLREYMLPGLYEMYEDLMAASRGADLLVSGEIVFAARSVAEKLGLKWVSTSMAPLSLFTVHEPNIYPNAQFFRYFNFLGKPFHSFVHLMMRRVIDGWLDPYRDFREKIGLDPADDPILKGKYSELLHLALFSSVLGARQPDWPATALQTGFCFYDGRKDIGTMPEGLEEFLASREPPIVFTLGSAAVMDPGEFFEQSIQAAKMMNRRAVFLYGVFNEPPSGLDGDRVGFDYAPFGLLFPKAACVVHQGGAGTTAQSLRAGVPQLIMPFSHDQPDNAARCERLGVARTIRRGSYNAETAAAGIEELITDESYLRNAREVSREMEFEDGAGSACDAIEALE